MSALATDLGRPSYEAWFGDIASTAREIEYLRSHLRKWSGEESVSSLWQLTPSSARVVREPLGVALVIAPWNFPVYILLTAMAPAIAAGNAVLGKPSELAPNVSAVLAERLPAYVDSEAIAIVEGGVQETTELLQERFDHIHYTGSGRVGRIVAQAAAHNLTPVTLELGGKSPVIVDRDASLAVAASRIVWGKLVNAGQTCVAPDYLLVHHDVESELLERIIDLIDKRYGTDPSASPDFGRIVNETHTKRLAGLLHGGGYQTVACGGTVDIAARYVAPTVLTGVDPDAPIMSEEIFGPILPVITVNDTDEAISFINARPKPLAVYVFTGSSATSDQVIQRTSSGGVVVNDLMSHVLTPTLPLGGVGESGYGAYHGRWGFETFSHRKAILARPKHWIEPPLATPPYRDWKQRIVRRLI